MEHEHTLEELSILDYVREQMIEAADHGYANTKAGRDRMNGMADVYEIIYNRDWDATN
jgi:hypothetical protein